jgi:hypothetical protein
MNTYAESTPTNKEPVMKYQTTLIFMFLALVSSQSFAHEDYRHGHHGSNGSERYRHSDRYRHNDRNRYDRQWNRQRDRYNYRDNDRKNYQRERQPGYGRLMNYSPDRFARWYADTAIEQIERARRYGCSPPRYKGRWRYNWNDHYRHGLKERRERSIREVETRDRELAQCRRYSYRH